MTNPCKEGLRSWKPDVGTFHNHLKSVWKLSLSTCHSHDWTRIPAGADDKHNRIDQTYKGRNSLHA